MRQWFLLSLLLVGEAAAFEPCKPFCDSGCSVPALLKMGGTVSAAYGQMTTQNTVLNSSLVAVDAAIIEQATVLGATWFEQLSLSTSALGAQTSVWLLSEFMRAKTMADNTDNIAQNLYTSLKPLLLSAKVNDNNQTYLQNAMPETGEIFTNKAAHHKTALKKNDALHREILQRFIAYSAELQTGDESIAASIRASFNEKLFDISHFTTDSSLSDEEFSAYQDLFTFVVNTRPLPATSNGNKTDVLAVKIYNAKLAFVMDAVLSLLVEQTQTIETDWVRSYMTRTSVATSISEVEGISGLVKGRLSSSGYYLDIKSLSTAGLQRELTYLKAEENYLLYQSNKKSQLNNNLLIIGLIQVLNKAASALHI